MGIRDHTVEVNLCVSDANGGRTDILVSIEFVTTNGHADAVNFSFVGVHGADKVSYFSTGGDLVGFYKKDGLSAVNVGGTWALSSM
jgi:hypothetical protein